MTKLAERRKTYAIQEAKRKKEDSNLSLSFALVPHVDQAKCDQMAGDGILGSADGRNYTSKLIDCAGFAT